MPQLESLLQPGQETSIFRGNGHAEDSHGLRHRPAIEGRGFEPHGATAVGVQKLQTSLSSFVVIAMDMRGRRCRVSGDVREIRSFVAGAEYKPG